MHYSKFISMDSRTNNKVQIIYICDCCLMHRLGQMQNHVEHLLVAYSELVPSSSSAAAADDPAMAAFTSTCTKIMQSLCQEVWPCLALVGGVNTGYVRGGWFEHC